MANGTSDTINQTVNDFNQHKAGDDFSNAANDLSSLKASDMVHFKDDLAQINSQVDFKKLGFNEDFSIEDAKPVALLTKSGNGDLQIRSAADLTQIKATQPSDGSAPEAQAAPIKSEAIGSHGRQIDVKPDGSAAYTAQAGNGDCYWRVAADLLTTRTGQTPSDGDVSQYVDELAKYNNKTDPDQLAVGEKIEIPPAVQSTQAEQTQPADPEPAQAQPQTQAQAQADLAQPQISDQTPVASDATIAAPQDIPQTGPPDGLLPDAASLTPQGGSYNVIAPPAQGFGKFGETWSEARDLAATRNKDSESTGDGGSTTDNYSGLMNNGTAFNWFASSYNAQETVNKAGQLEHRKIDYTSGGFGLPSVSFITSEGANSNSVGPDANSSAQSNFGSINIDQVTMVETNRDDKSGQYATTVVDAAGEQWQAISGADGKPISLVQTAGQNGQALSPG